MHVAFIHIVCLHLELGGMLKRLLFDVFDRVEALQPGHFLRII